MDSKNESEQIKPIFDLNDVKSNYMVKSIFNYIKRNKSLNIIKFNKNVQEILDITIKDYKYYYETLEIGIIPVKDKYGKFINIGDKKECYHIIFDDRGEEINRNYLTEEDEVSKIRILIDPEVKSLKNLFNGCECIKYIYSKRFNRTDINDMSYMFNGCSSLKKFEYRIFQTNNVLDMSYMFNGCTSLKELDLSKIITHNVTNMSHMFNECSSLITLKLNKFDTHNVTNMSHMFNGCSSLMILNLNIFDTHNVTNMSHMFSECSLLNEIKLSNFKTNEVYDMSYMFYKCSSLKKLDLSFFYTNKVYDTSHMFEECSSLKELNLHNFITTGCNMNYMFNNCSSLEILDISNLCVYNSEGDEGLLNGCYSLRELHIAHMFGDFEDDIEALIKRYLGDCSDHLKNYVRKEFKELKKI